MDFIFNTAVIFILLCILTALIMKASGASIFPIYEEGYWTLVLFMFVSVLCAIAILAMKEQEDRGPCFRYETKLMYNASTKTMMPAKICVERGEWTNDE